MDKAKKLYAWSWIGGGYNQVYARTEGEARRLGNAICDGLTIDESTFRLVRDRAAFWKSYPVFD